MDQQNILKCQIQNWFQVFSDLRIHKLKYWKYDVQCDVFAFINGYTFPLASDILIVSSSKEQGKRNETRIGPFCNLCWESVWSN